MSSPSSRKRKLRLGVVLSLTLVGCAPPSSAARTAKPRPLNEIAKAEIEAEGPRFSTVYEMVRTLRPTMLQSRGVATAPQSRSVIWEANTGMKVYLDGFRYGGIESLRTISASDVAEVRWLSSMDATTRFGTGNAAGAIAVTSRTGRR